MRRTLEVAANGLLIVTCALAAVVLLRKLDLLPMRAEARRLLQAGDRVPAEWHTQAGAAGKSVVVVLRSTCGFCTASMSVYRQIAAAKGVRFIAVSDEPQAVTQRYLESNGVAAAQIVSAERETLRVRGTPTLFLLDQAGVIRQREVGRLDEPKRRELLAALR
jgi:thiol-disulfide isomerase/thioredoxin